MPRVASSAAFASIFACKAAFVDPPRRLLFLLVCSGPTSAAELLLAESWLSCVLAESSLSFGAPSPTREPGRRDVRRSAATPATVPASKPAYIRLDISPGAGRRAKRVERVSPNRFRSFGFS